MSEKLSDKKITMTEIAFLSSQRKCVNCSNWIEIKGYHIPICRKCRKKLMNEVKKEKEE